MLDIDISSVVIFAIIWILLFVLKKVFFNPLQKVRAERDALINQNKMAAAKSKEDYEQTLSEIEEQIKKARMDAVNSRNKLEKDAQEKKEELIADVSKESKKMVEKGKADLEEQMKILFKEMEAKSGAFAKNIEKRLLH
ncbi:MAG: ATP synthase F0 subunit B [Candidatus Aminicenantaceae bacterium]